MAYATDIHLMHLLLGFIAIQDSDRHVDHCSWDSCAIGDYLETRPAILEMDDNLYPRGAASWLSEVVCRTNPALHQVLGSPRKHSAGTTYGELQYALAQKGIIPY